MQAFGLQLGSALQSPAWFSSSVYYQTRTGLVNLILDVFLVLPFNYSCVLLVYSYKNLWKSTSSPWCNQWRKKTDKDTVHCDSCIFTAHAAIRYFPDSQFRVITHFHSHFAADLLSVILFFRFFVLGQLSCQSSLLCI